MDENVRGEIEAHLAKARDKLKSARILAVAHEFARDAVTRGVPGGRGAT